MLSLGIVCKHPLLSLTRNFLNSQFSILNSNSTVLPISTGVSGAMDCFITTPLPLNFTLRPASSKQ